MRIRPTQSRVHYPTRDGRPIGETELHRDLLIDLIRTLQICGADNPHFYVSGNLLMYYEQGNKRKHGSPDVFVVPDLPRGKAQPRDYYLVWEEGRTPALVIELTSKSTRKEDLNKKFRLYREVLRVEEYFLFDPYAEYLKPPLQGFRLSRGRYVRIKPIDGRLPSQVLGMHLERNGSQLRLYNPVTSGWLPTPQEVLAHAEAENERLRRELEALRRQLPEGS